MLKDLVDVNYRVEIYIYILILDLTRNRSEKCNYRSSGRNRACSPVILVQCSNQLSYRETVVEL